MGFRQGDSEGFETLESLWNLRTLFLESLVEFQWNLENLWNLRKKFNEFQWNLWNLPYIFCTSFEPLGFEGIADRSLKPIHQNTAKHIHTQLNIPER